ncbi:hypothetical protein HYN49_13180 [Flavobacterium pallidum]|uniref:Uncharacterized protein n=2 Tax=Flavobacterium pallidum TaxID=2172098 RepID=A0A2S1SK05_9FLAO|nr:hypothetical protein HYN49_13180 [Flavobacterium pallidum]
MLLFPHRFKPPKKENIQEWEVVKYLIENGFKYQHIYKNVELKNGVMCFSGYADYPTNIRDAKEFVEKYIGQAQK